MQRRQSRKLELLFGKNMSTLKGRSSLDISEVGGRKSVGVREVDVQDEMVKWRRMEKKLKKRVTGSESFCRLETPEGVEVP